MDFSKGSFCNFEQVLSVFFSQYGNEWFKLHYNLVKLTCLSEFQEHVFVSDCPSKGYSFSRYLLCRTAVNTQDQSLFCSSCQQIQPGLWAEMYLHLFIPHDATLHRLIEQIRSDKSDKLCNQVMLWHHFAFTRLTEHFSSHSFMRLCWGLADSSPGSASERRRANDWFI